VTYEGEEYTGSIAYTGTADAIQIIPTGAIVRLSLARTRSSTTAELPSATTCALMVSGWFV